MYNGIRGNFRKNGDRNWKKHNENVKDNRLSIRLIKVSNVGGESGALILLAEGIIIDLLSLQNVQNKVLLHILPQS
jgi:hypothetical protein